MNLLKKLSILHIKEAAKTFGYLLSPLKFQITSLVDLLTVMLFIKNSIN